MELDLAQFLNPQVHDRTTELHSIFGDREVKLDISNVPLTRNTVLVLNRRKVSFIFDIRLLCIDTVVLELGY